MCIRDRCRSNDPSHKLFDVIRGGGKVLESDDTSAEETNQEYGYLSAFNTNGFTLTQGTHGSFPMGNVNHSGRTYVAWCWKAGGSGVSNSDGTITSSVSANTEAGFSVVTWTGSGADASIGHGLGKKPHVIFVKNRSAGDNWRVWWRNVTIGDEYALVLNDTTGVYTGSDKWYNSPNGNDTTTTTFGVSNDGSTNRSGESFVGYCWAEIPGYSKFGTYTGSGNATDGPFVHTGFRVGWLMTKRSSSARNWIIYDNKRGPHNEVDNFLEADTNNQEDSKDTVSYTHLTLPTIYSV